LFRSGHKSRSEPGRAAGLRFRSGQRTAPGFVSETESDFLEPEGAIGRNNYVYKSAAYMIIRFAQYFLDDNKKKYRDQSQQTIVRSKSSLEFTEMRMREDWRKFDRKNKLRTSTSDNRLNLTSRKGTIRFDLPPNDITDEEEEEVPTLKEYREDLSLDIHEALKEPEFDLNCDEVAKHGWFINMIIDFWMIVFEYVFDFISR